jgi:hypothetical protein
MEIEAGNRLHHLMRDEIDGAQNGGKRSGHRVESGGRQKDRPKGEAACGYQPFDDEAPFGDEEAAIAEPAGISDVSVVSCAWILWACEPLGHYSVRTTERRLRCRSMTC